MLLLKRLFIATVVLIGCTSFLTQAQDIELTDPTLLTPSEYQITNVEVEGNERTRAQFIINASSLTVGSSLVYPGDQLSRAVERLYNSGLFSDVKVYITQRTESEIQFLIEVTEQPRILEYKLRNIKRSERRDLRDLLVITPGTVISEATKGQAVNTIKRFYREKGYWFTEVEVMTEEVEEVEDRLRLIFNIDPGSRLEIKDIEFIGNDSFSDRKLRRNLKPVKEDAWWKIFGKKVYKEDEYEEGTQSLLDFYRKNGYVDARIIKDSIYTKSFDGLFKEKEGLKLELTIDEGPQYKVRNVSWEGNTVYTDEQ
ncbi:MAG TPA: outer membrane protein assembly factor BamA, partial [Balneolaceae bacterium]|nr:outer membrane protein assembly factor BamA [Balneolaceae bacterium]